MFIHTYIGSGHFLGLKILNLTIFFFGKTNIFGGMNILWIFFWVITKLDYIYGSLLCILRSFLKVKVQNGGYFWAAKISKFFFWCLKFLKFLG